MNKIKAIAFDLDGLMVNTEEIYDEVCEKLLAKRGSHFDLELKLKMMGRPGPVAIEIMKTERGISDSVEELQFEVETYFHEILPDKVDTLPGLIRLLDFVEEQNLPKCVATSSFRKHASAVLDHCGLHGRFEFVLTSEDVVNGKPAPEVYLLAAEKHSVHPEEMLVLEDSVLGSTAGVAAGAVVVAVPGSHSIDCDYSHVPRVADSLNDDLIYELLIG
ncbi:HAD family phosphatase [bacterium]|jgi:HAD superfamily hydrolase (TIGR01509 family)|nr:HAD family phosphatase [bacterium]MDB4413027.1 HAD family phosphatase [Pirellulaceae bacterium]